MATFIRKIKRKQYLAFERLGKREKDFLTRCLEFILLEKNTDIENCSVSFSFSRYRYYDDNTDKKIGFTLVESLTIDPKIKANIESEDEIKAILKALIKSKQDESNKIDSEEIVLYVKKLLQIEEIEDSEIKLII